MKQVFNSKTNDKRIKHFYESAKSNENTHILGYFVEDELVGTVTLNNLISPSGKYATIWNLAVQKEYRRLGIASKLMKNIEQIAKSDEYIDKIWLFSGYRRKNAHKLYKKLGYSPYKDKAFIKQIRD